MISNMPDIVGILKNARELDRLGRRQKRVLLEINKLHKTLQDNPEVVLQPGDKTLSKLKALYTLDKYLAESEVNVSEALLSQLDSVLPSEPVAAKVTGDNVEKDEWFVVKVINVDMGTKEFEVLDEKPGDNEEGAVQKKYKVPMSSVIPFPKRNDPSNAPEYPSGRHVLAVYPSTTALYKATVVGPPRKEKTDDYLLEFEDDEEDGSLPQKTMPFHLVVPLPEGHRQ